MPLVMDKLLTRGFLPQVNSFRTITGSQILCSRKNFRKFILPHRGSEKYNKDQKENPHPDIFPLRFGVRDTHLKNSKKKTDVPEKIPDLIVPDLTDFNLLPYVSYRATDVVQSEFTSKDLFNAIYRRKIVKDFETNKLDENGNPKEPSDAELLTAEEAKKAAQRTGSDLFEEGKRRDY